MTRVSGVLRKPAGPRDRAPAVCDSPPVYRRVRSLLSDPGNRVIALAVVMIVAQLGFRAWAVYGSWFQLDDFTFMSRLASRPMDFDMLAVGHAGHLMPFGFVLSWANMQVDPLAWALPATELLIMQAVASVGVLVLLVSAFGRRLGILVPLAIYLFTVLSLPAFVWWAAGVNQIPLQIAIGWAGWTHLNYLRTRRTGWLVATVAITVGALGFYEKTLLIYAFFAFLALAYFATGDLLARMRHIIRTYRAGVIAHSVVVVAYVPFYVEYGLNFDPNRANAEPLLPVFLNVVAVAYGTGVVGGPLQWTHPSEIFSLPDPTQLLNLFALAVVGAIVYEISRSRLRAKRAWILPALFLGPSVLLLAGGRTSFVGPDLALDYRYQTELAAITAVALGLALFPLRGATEQVEVTRTSSFLDLPVRVGVTTAVVAALGIYSSTTYALHWNSGDTTKRYFAALESSLADVDEPVPLVDAAVPEEVVGALTFPYNLASNALHMHAEKTRYPSASTDELRIVAPDGEIRPVVIDPLRTGVGAQTGCPYPARFGRASVKLDAPVFGTGWWVRVSYAADGDSPLVVRAGDERHEPGAVKGLHSLFFEASGEFQTIEFSGLDPDVTFCITEAELGVPVPADAPEE